MHDCGKRLSNHGVTVQIISVNGCSIFRKPQRPVERFNVHDDRPVVAINCWPSSDQLVARLTSYFESWTTLLLCQSRQLSVSHIPSILAHLVVSDRWLVKHVGVLCYISNHFDMVVLIIPAEMLPDLTSEPSPTELYAALSFGNCCCQSTRVELGNEVLSILDLVLLT